jgi:hypothetical protein
MGQVRLPSKIFVKLFYQNVVTAIHEIDRFMQQYHTSACASAKNGGVCFSGLKITGKIGKGANTPPLSPTASEK